MNSSSAPSDAFVNPGDVADDGKEATKRLRRDAARNARKKVLQVTSGKPIAEDSSDNDLAEAQEILRRVRKNRQARQSAFGLKDFSKRRSRDEAGTPACFICGEILHGTVEDINIHIDSCLSRGDSSGSPSQTIMQATSQAPAAFESYTWAGQTRVRATTMLEGGFAAAGLATVKRKEADEDDVDIDLDVDEDDTTKFGAQQYDESALKSFIQEPSPDEPLVSNAQSESFESSKIIGSDPQSAVLVDSLKAKIRQQEALIAGVVKCLICLESYIKPCVSINCWHVHCETCWLRTLASKKLCPQCNVITSPGDLRRVYL